MMPRHQTGSTLTRIKRIISLISLIDSSPSHSASQISQELGVSKRTVYRDLAMLDQCGVPTLFEETTSGYILPSPISCRLNSGELICLLIALHAFKLCSAPIFAKRLNQATVKLAKMLPVSERDSLKKLWRLFERPLNQSRRRQEDHLLTILSAVSHDKALKVTYESTLMDSRTIRIRPSGIRIREINWELIGKLDDQQHHQMFPLDRILATEIDD